MYTFKNLVLITFALSLLMFASGCTEEENLTPPSIEDQRFSIEEQMASGTVVGTVIALSSDNNDLKFTILSGNTGNAFTIGSSDGIISVDDASVLDFETNPSFSLVIEVKSGELVNSAIITITLIDVDEVPSIISDQAFTVDENSPAETVIGTVTATDLNGDGLTAFSITSGNTDNIFAIGSATGILTVAVSDALDFETKETYSLTVQVIEGDVTQSATATITINDLLVETLPSEAAVISSLSDIYTNSFPQYVELTYLFDAVYANSSNSPGGDWDNIYNHTVTSADTKVEQLWNDAYEIIYGLNNIIVSSDNLSLGTQYSAEASAMRGFLYYTLSKWFESVPLELGISNSNASNATKSEVLAQVSSDMNTAISNLSAATNQEKITQGFAKQVMARLEADSQNWSAAMSQTSSLIDGAAYSLAVSTSSFSQDNSEILWGFSNTGNTEFNSFFQKGSYIPAARYTETLLIHAEANLEAASLSDAITTLNQVHQRTGTTLLVLASTTQDAARSAILAAWETELPQEGEIFSALIRFGVAESRLGIPTFRKLLPIPQSVIDTNENLFQNPGY